jgi:hypothetical protein
MLSNEAFVVCHQRVPVGPKSGALGSFLICHGPGPQRETRKVWSLTSQTSCRITRRVRR